jgi:hypothetical protein
MSAANQSAWKPPEGDRQAAAWTPPATDRAPAPQQPSAASRAAGAYSEGTGLTLLRDLMAGASRTKEGAEKTKAAFTTLVEGIKSEPARVLSELSEMGRSMLNLDLKGTAYHAAGSVPLVGAPAQQVGKDVAEGKYPEAVGHGAALLTPFVGKTRPVQAAKRGAAAVIEKTAPAVERVGQAVDAGVKAAAPDVAAGSAKVAVGSAAGAAAHGLGLPGAIPYAVGGAPAYAGARQVQRGLGKGWKAGKEAFRSKITAATEKMAAAEVSPGQAYAETQGISAAEYAALAPEERAMFDNAAKAQTPVGPRQPVPPEAPPPAEAGPGDPAPAKTLTDMLREELEAKRAAQPQAPAPQPPPAPAPKRQHPQRLPEGFTRAGKLDPSEGNWTGSRPLPRTAADYAPRPVAVESPAVAPPEAPPLPRQEVIPPQPTAAPAAVEPVAPTLPPTLAQQSPTSPTPAPTVANASPTVAPTLNPVEIGRRIMRSMGMEDVPAKDALQTFQHLQELAARTGESVEAVFQKYTGEPLAGVAAPPAPKVSITLDDFGPHAGRSFDKFAKTYEGFADTAARDRLLGLAEQISKADGKKPELRHLMEAMQYEGAAVAEGVGTGADLLRSLADGVDPSKGKVFTDAQYRGGGIIGGERARRIMGEGSPAPRPITPKQGEAAMFRTKEAQAPVNPNLDPNETRTFTAASGEGKSKALRAEEKKVYNADAKSARWAEALNKEGVTAEDVRNMQASDWNAMSAGLKKKGLIGDAESNPKTSIPRLIKRLKELEAEARMVRK